MQQKLLLKWENIVTKTEKDLTYVDWWAFQGLKYKSKMNIGFIGGHMFPLMKKDEAEKAAESQRDNRRNIAKVSLREN